MSDILNDLFAKYLSNIFKSRKFFLAYCATRYVDVDVVLGGGQAHVLGEQLPNSRVSPPCPSVPSQTACVRFDYWRLVHFVHMRPKSLVLL